MQAYTLALLQNGSIPPGIRLNRMMQTVTYLSDIDDRLTTWARSLPSSWTPIRVSGKEYIPPNIPQVGLYQSQCDIYTSIFICSLWNKQRVSQIRAMQLVINCLSLEPAAASTANQLDACQQGIQQAVDYVCASVPFNIGDRMEPEDRVVNYPHAPGRPVSKDHYQSGPAMGGWSLLQPLGIIWGMKIKLRDGQKQWIGGQMARIARIYGIRRGQG
jgi:hypothetical protein